MPRQKEDERLDVKFETRAVRNKARSDGEKVMDNENNVVHEIKGSGRDEFDNVPYVLIGIPGDKTAQIDRPVLWCGGVPQEASADSVKIRCRAPQDMRGRPRLNECDVHRFPDEWQAFRAGTEQMTGQPLSKWGEIDPASLRELSYFNVHTIEQLSQLTDSNATKFFHLRQKARDFLAADGAKDKQIKEMQERLMALEAKTGKVGKEAAR